MVSEEGDGEHRAEGKVWWQGLGLHCVCEPWVQTLPVPVMQLGTALWSLQRDKVTQAPLGPPSWAPCVQCETQGEAGQTDTGSELQQVGQEKLQQVGLTVRCVRKQMAKPLLVQGGERGVKVLAHTVWRRWYRVQCTVPTSLYSKLVTFLY